MQEIDIKRRKLECIEHAINEDHIELKENEKVIRVTRERNVTCQVNVILKSLDIHADYNVSPFTDNTKAKCEFVRVHAENDGNKCVYFADSI